MLMAGESKPPTRCAGCGAKLLDGQQVKKAKGKGGVEVLTCSGVCKQVVEAVPR